MRALSRPGVSGLLAAIVAGCALGLALLAVPALAAAMRLTVKGVDRAGEVVTVQAVAVSTSTGSLFS